MFFFIENLNLIHTDQKLDQFLQYTKDIEIEDTFKITSVSAIPVSNPWSKNSQLAMKFLSNKMQVAFSVYLPVFPKLQSIQALDTNAATRSCEWITHMKFTTCFKVKTSGISYEAICARIPKQTKSDNSAVKWCNRIKIEKENIHKQSMD